MGDKIPLVEAEKLNSKLLKEHKYGQSTADNYTIWLPTKDKSGKLKLAIIAFYNDLNKGFLAFNRENIVRQVFKKLGEYENKYYWIYAGSGYGEVDQTGNFKSRSIRSVFVMELKQFLGTEDLSYLAKFT